MGADALYSLLQPYSWRSRRMLAHLNVILPKCTDGLHAPAIPFS
jgi:hypothetical protein